jgi:translation initiation factor 3 subunit C
VLEKLLEVSQTPYQQIRVLLAIISARFDYNPSAVYMPLELWTAAKQEIDRLISMVGPDSGYSIEENPLEYDDSIERSPEGGVPVHIRGSIISFLDRLDDEFTKSLQNLDPHGTEYVERLKDEAGLYVTVCRCQQHYEARGKSDSFFRAIMRRIEHIYSKVNFCFGGRFCGAHYFQPSIVVQALESAAPGLVSEDAKSKQSKVNPSELVHQLCAQLYQSGNSLLRTRSMLWHIYHHALYNNFHAARDMLLMSHLQENIHAADVPTQILFNRAIVQLGLCAFRSGLIKEAQSILLEIFSTQRVKELLAQGMYHARYPVLTPEQEKAEKLRQMPFHMHINTELLEGAFLVSSMLIEIPMIASIDSEELKRKMISKPFRRLLDFADRQTFSGPPETTRDHIMQASKALRDGDWKKCRDLILGIQIWSLMPEEKQVKEMLSRYVILKQRAS